MDVVICNPGRTPVGRMGGALSALTAAELATAALRALVERTGLSEDQVDDVVLGNGYANGGLSLGGMTAMRVAGRNPERVERLALLSTGAQLPPAESSTERAATLRAEGSQAVAAGVVGRWFTAAYLDAHPGVCTEHERMIASTPAEGYACCCEALAKLDLRDQLSGISARTLVIAGEDDPATPPAKLEEIAVGIPNAQMLVVPRGAHVENAERADIITPALIEHVERQ